MPLAAGGNSGGGGRRILPDGRGGFTIATSTGGAGSRAPQQQQQPEAGNKRSRGVGTRGGRFETTGDAAVAAVPAIYREAGFLVDGKKKNVGKGGGAAGVRVKKGPAQKQQQQQNKREKGLSSVGAASNRSLEELMSGGLAAVRR